MIDTTSPSGELVFHIISALAQFERRLIQERTKAGLAAARVRGRKGGRPPLSASDPRLVPAKKLHGDRTLSINDVCRTLSNLPFPPARQARCRNPVARGQGLRDLQRVSSD
jgi:DNA invertase Pin-like site-specific DNA recombinase